MNTETALKAAEILSEIKWVKKDINALDKMETPSEIHFRKNNTFSHYPTYAFTV